MIRSLLTVATAFALFYALSRAATAQEVQQGVEALARGPVHEAYAEPVM
jgi:hypothetical protein